MRIACLLDGEFEDSQFSKPAVALLRAGHELVVVGFHGGAELIGRRGEVRVRTDLGVDETASDDFGALLIPGGYSPDRLRGDQRMVSFTKGFFLRDRPVFTICHGPQLLITAGVVTGRKMTAWKTIQRDLKLAGANVVDREVVTDGNLVTSRHLADLGAFMKASLALLSEREAA
jgi:protease I